MPPRNDEERPLLRSESVSGSQNSQDQHEIKFEDHDEENPKQWSPRRKYINVGIVALMALLSPLASSMFTPGISEIAQDLNTTEQAVIATTTGYVVMLGIGPLVLAPLSETFGRRKLYIICFAIFTLLQIPTALSPNIATLIAVRTISGFFGSVGIANGGGTINDMYDSSERAGIFGLYLLGPLLGPTLGPLFGGIIVTRINWRAIYWILLIICVINTTVGYFFLRETYAPVLLNKRKQQIVSDDTDNEGVASTNYYFEGEDRRPLGKKIRSSMKRPIVIFIQPIVFVMSLYQALIFGTTYSIYTNMQAVFSAMPYNFNSEQVGLLYLGPGLGFLVAVLFIVPRIDTIYNKLTKQNKGKSMPEYRLPLANIGSVVIPVSLFAFAWTVQTGQHWIVPIIATFFYGIGQVIIFNTVQNYYIDAFSKYAASAIAGGAVFRSFFGGVVPLFAPMLFKKLDYGWGISVFAFVAVVIAPSPALFYWYGPRIRDRFQIQVE